jgi:hypothetical protein
MCTSLATIPLSTAKMEGNEENKTEMKAYGKYVHHLSLSFYLKGKKSTQGATYSIKH